MSLVDKIRQWVSTQWQKRGVRRVLLYLLIAVLVVAGFYALARIFLFTMGTIMQFWYNYTQTTWLLWLLTLVTMFVIAGFGYLLWVRRSEYLSSEAEDELRDDVYGGFGE